MSTRMRADAQLFKHDNYAASAGHATKTLPAHTSSILIDNMDASINVFVSFDGGSNYKSIPAGQSLSVDFDSLKSYIITAEAGTPHVECLYGYEA